jgi:Holliday junction resolvase RusA-like endonuclease
MPSPFTLRINGRPTPKGTADVSILPGGRRRCPHCQGPLGVLVRPTTDAAEKRLALQLGDLHQGPPLEGPLAVDIEFVMPRPKARFRKADPDGRIRHAKKPDADNLTKLVLDAMQRCLACGEHTRRCRCAISCPMLLNDSHVAWLRARKWIGAIEDRRAKVAEAPHTLIYLKELGR